LFEKGPNWDYNKYRSHMFEKPAEDEQLPELHFFDGKATASDALDSVVMTSFPRSGNSMLRATLERIMGIVTGSDADLKAKLHGALMDEGLVGEGLCSKKVWVIKTHWPERSGKHNFDSERALLLVRSPLDCITSLFHMTLSGSHDLSVSEPDFKTFSKNFEAMVKQDMTVWKDFHEFWLKAKVPTHFVRYEDLC